jgi:hypothetical protein
MINYDYAKEKIDSLKNIDMALYGDTKGQIRKYIIEELEKYLFNINVSCPELYLNEITVENSTEKQNTNRKISILINQ